VKNDEGYQSKWIRKNQNRPFVNSAEKNIIGDEREQHNEFLNNSLKRNNKTKTNNFFNKNRQENPQDLKSLEVEIGKVLNKLNEISESIKLPNYH